MGKAIYAILLLLFVCKIEAQNNNEDYCVLDGVLPLLIKNSRLNVYEKASVFENQEMFFSETFLKDYTYPTIGVDSKKIKKLIKKLDFDYLSRQKRENIDWDFSKLNYPIVKYFENPTNQFDKIQRYKISRPVYSKNRIMAFVYYQDICGFIDCGSANVIILKKRNGKWKVYLTIPIRIS